MPDYAKYEYTASGGLPSSKWLEAVGGTITQGTGTSDVHILWLEGGEVGKAVYSVNSDYIWGKRINGTFLISAALVFAV